MTKSIVTKKRPEKSLLQHLKKTAGRSREGRITIWHRGGGSRKLYRIVDFGQEHLGVRGVIETIEYDPNRNAYVSLVRYADGEKGYVLAPRGVAAGDEIVCDNQTEVKLGNRMKLKHIPVGEMVYNVALEADGPGKIVRAAGTSARIGAQEGKYVHLILPSSEVRKVLSECFACIGMVSRPEFRYQKVQNAGRARLKGRRPRVRGVAMNPVDHPHGGGEGRSPIGMKYPKTPWGKHALGVKTRKRKQTNKFILQRRNKKKRKK